MCSFPGDDYIYILLSFFIIIMVLNNKKRLSCVHIDLQLLSMSGRMSVLHSSPIMGHSMSRPEDEPHEAPRHAVHEYSEFSGRMLSGEISNTLKADLTRASLKHPQETDGKCQDVILLVFFQSS